MELPIPIPQGKKSFKKVMTNKRSWQRYEVFLEARYITKSCYHIKTCIVLNIGRGGTCLLLPQDGSIAKGASIFLQVITRDSEKLNIKGEVVWVKKIENILAAGMKFFRILDMDTVDRISALI
jgi:hypothetical protein